MYVWIRKTVKAVGFASCTCTVDYSICRRSALPPYVPSYFFQSFRRVFCRFALRVRISRTRRGKRACIFAGLVTSSKSFSCRQEQDVVNTVWGSTATRVGRCICGHPGAEGR